MKTERELHGESKKCFVRLIHEYQLIIYMRYIALLEVNPVKIMMLSCSKVFIIEIVSVIVLVAVDKNKPR
jgi:hypothetical protein